MALLILGVLIWSCVHFVPCLGVGMRAACIERIGEGPYKGVFALSIIAAIVLMVVGWRSTTPAAVYDPPAWGASAASLAMLVSLVLFAGSGAPSNLKRIVRHPQLTGLATWALAHLLANGDQRSLVLFGGLGAWAVVTIMAINRRDGAWQKPEPVPLAAEAKLAVGVVVVYALLVLAHPYIAGVAPFAD